MNQLLRFVPVAILLCSCTAKNFNVGVPSSGAGSVRKRMTGTGAPLTTTQADALIDTSVTGLNRKVLREFIENAPYAESAYAMHGNVDIVLYDADAGTFITNKQSLERAFSVRSEDDTVPAVPQRYFSDTVNRNSGPYRRILSHPRPYTINAYNPFTSAVVDLQCNNTTSPTVGLVKQDEGDIMLGGWSAGGSSVDAGLQYNYNAKTHPIDDYQMFILLANNGVKIGSKDGTRFLYSEGFFAAPGGSYNLPCGEQVTLTYSVQKVGQSELALVVSALPELAPPGRYFGYLFTPGSSASVVAAGWDIACLGCVMKRETTIGQRGADGHSTDALTNGDEFRATWGGAEITCGWETGGSGCSPSNDVEAWYNLWSCSEYPNWTTFQAGGRDCTNMPFNAQDTRVRVSGFTLTGEMDDIYLAPADTSAPYQAWGPFIGNTNVPGLRYATNAFTNGRSFGADVLFINDTDKDITVEIPQGDCSSSWIATVTRIDDSTLQLRQPSPTTRCRQSVSWSRIPARTTGTLVGTASWDAGRVRTASYSVAMPALNYYESGTLAAMQIDGATVSSGPLKAWGLPPPHI